MPEKVFTVEGLERERQAKLKEAVAGEPNFRDEEDEEYSDELLKQIADFQSPDDPNAPPTCKSYAAAEALIIKAMKQGAKMADVRLDLTNQRLSVVPADVLRLGESLVQLSVVGNTIVELPTDLDLCKRLRVLNLAANELSGLPKLTTLKGLVHVGLAYNRVTDQALGALHRCLPAALQSLDLTANELVHLDTLLELFEEKFHSMRHLSLMSNPLVRPPGLDPRPSGAVPPLLYPRCLPSCLAFSARGRRIETVFCRPSRRATARLWPSRPWEATSQCSTAPT